MKITSSNVIQCKDHRCVTVTELVNTDRKYNWEMFHEIKGVTEIIEQPMKQNIVCAEPDIHNDIDMN